MAKVMIFAAVLAVVIAAITVSILLIGGSTKLTSLMWRGKKNKSNEERSDKDDQGPFGPASGGRGSDWV